MPRSAPEAELRLQFRAVGITYAEQYRWHPDRRFRSDFAVWSSPIHAGMLDPFAPEKPLLIEIDGAKRGAPGAHQRVDGIDADCRRAAEAMLLGYRMLRVSSRMVFDGTALQIIEKLLESG